MPYSVVKHIKALRARVGSSDGVMQTSGLSSGRELATVSHNSPDTEHPRYTVAIVDTIKQVSTRLYPFSHEERIRGIAILPGTWQYDFWTLISSYGENAVDPVTECPFGAVDDMKSELIMSHDSEMHRACEYFHLLDKMSHLENDNPVSKGADPNRLTLDIEHAYVALSIAKEMRAQCLHSWKACRDRRKLNLTMALFMYKCATQGCSPLTLGPWCPSPSLLSALREELKELHGGVQLSEWYTAMSYGTCITGRPFFSASELDPSYLTISVDPYHLCPFEMTVSERLAWVLKDDGYTFEGSEEKRETDSVVP